MRALFCFSAKKSEVSIIPCFNQQEINQLASNTVHTVRTTVVQLQNLASSTHIEHQSITDINQRQSTSLRTYIISTNPNENTYSIHH
jgi:hypothetical protein